MTSNTISNVKIFKISHILFLISLLLAGCNETLRVETAEVEEELTNLQDPREMVIKSFKYIDRDYNSNSRCYELYRNDQKYCIYIDQASLIREGNKAFIYAVEIGMPIDENGKKELFHGIWGSLKFYKFELNNEKLQLIAESDFISCGVYGGPCDVNTYKLGNTPDLGWVVGSSDMNEGRYISSIVIYAAIGRKIKAIGSNIVYFNNKGVCDSENCKQIEYTVKNKKKITPSQKYYDLQLEILGKITKNEEIQPLHLLTTIKFDEKKLKYNFDEVINFHQKVEK